MSKVLNAVKDAGQSLQALESTGQSGAGLVSVTMTGKFHAKQVNIDESLLQEPKSVLEDLITAAINDATHKIGTQLKKQFGPMANLLG